MSIKENTRRGGLLKQAKIDLESLTSWWCDYGYDSENSRFYAEVSNENIPNNKAPYVIIQRTRLLWYFSVLSQLKEFDHYRNYADLLYEELINNFYDKSRGGFYWEVDASFNLLNDRKQIYAQAFAIYALSEYHSLSGNSKALNIALDTFDLIETHAWDLDMSGYIEALDSDWKMLTDFRLSSKDMNEPKSMNTHLHLLEAYTTLSRVSKISKVATSLERLLKLYATQFFNSDTGHFELFFDMDWNLKSNIVSYGHDIESAWLMQEAAEVSGDSELIKTAERLSIRIADVTMESGIAAVGGLKNEIEDGHLDTTYDWWPQAEAVVGFLFAYNIAGNIKYENIAVGIFEFIHDHVIDEGGGEWYWKISEELKPVQNLSKSSAWKAPYHNGRMYFELLKMTN